MKYQGLISAGLLLAALSMGAHGATLLPARVVEAAQQRVDAGEYPALVIGYVDGGKSEVDVFGKLDNGNAPDASTVFEIGSITKTFTATLLAEVVQSGRLQLDAPVANLLPGFKIPERNGKQISLIDIATQFSGLPRLPTNFKPADPANPYADYDSAKLKAFLAGYALTRDPGASYEYSNLGFGLLGFALAEKAHEDYGALLKQKILQPLGMTMSGVTLDDAMRTHLARGHSEDGKEVKNWDFDALAGCGAIRSNTDDMLRYLKANMGATKTALTSSMKFAQEPRRDISKNVRIGLAWMTIDNAVVWHNGMTGGYASFVGFSADGQRGVVILTNIQQTVDDLGLAALQADFPLQPVHKAVTLTAPSLNDYIGDYKLHEGFLLNISRNGDQLYAQATGQGAFPIFATAENEFFAKIAEISISFQRDAQGKVSGLVLHQNGDHAAPKLSVGEIATTTESVKLDTAVMRDYPGKYQLAGNAMFEVTLKDDQLYVQLTGQPVFPVYANAKDRFFLTVVDAQIDFERDKNGKVDALILHQNGQNQRAARIGD